MRPEADQRSATDTDGAEAGPPSRSMPLVEVIEPTGADTLAVTHLGGNEVTARLRADAEVARARLSASWSTWRKAVPVRPQDRAADRVMPVPTTPTSSSSAPASAARRWPRASPAAARGSSSWSAASGCADSAGHRDARAIFVERPLPPEGDLARRPGRSRSTPATTTMSAATRSSTARCMLRYRERGFRPTRARRRRLAGLADPLRRARALVRRGRAAVPGARRAGRRSDRAAALAALSASARFPTSRAIAAVRERLQAPGPAPVLAAARRSTSSAGCSARPDALGRLPRHAQRQDATPRPPPWPQALRRPDVTLVTGALVERLLPTPDGRRDRGRRVSSRTASAACCAPAPWCSPPARSTRRRSCCARASGRPRQPLGRGRPLLHEPQLHRDAGRRPARAQRLRSTRRRSASTTSTSTTARAARRSATSSCSARSPRPILKANAALGARLRPVLARRGTASTGT